MSGITTVAQTERGDGLLVEGPQPQQLTKEKGYLKEPSGQDYNHLAAAPARFLELRYYELHRKSYRTATERAVDMVRCREDDRHFPEADSAFDNSQLNLNLTREIEKRDPAWTREFWEFFYSLRA